MSGPTAPPYGTPVAGNDWTSALTAPPTGPVLGVSVVVVHYEQHAQLARTLHALSRQTFLGDLEVVVVDDGSAVPPVVPANVTLLRRPDEGFTAAAARNAGAAVSTEPLLVFLDADTTPEPGYVEELVRLPARLPEAVVVGRRRHAELTGTDVTAPVEEVAPPRELLEPAWLADGYRASGDLLRADGDSYRYVISSVLGCSRWLFDELGGFDETLDAYGGEDWEWAWRAWQHGAVLAHRPSAVAWHDGPDWSGRVDDAAAREAKAGETLRLARRMAAPTAALRGLVLGPAELVVTLDEGLSTTELVITVDSLLAAVPTTVVAATREQCTAIGADPRVVPRLPHHDIPDAPELAANTLRLHLTDGVRGSAAAWRHVVGLGRATDHPQTVTLSDESREVGRLEVLRAHRRAARWGRDDLFPDTTLDLAALPEPLRRLEGSDTLEAHVGGWLHP